MSDIRKVNHTVESILLAALPEFRRIWGRALLLTVLAFFIAIFLAIFLASMGAIIANDGWSAGGFLYNWVAIFIAYAVIIKLVGYLLEANLPQTGDHQPKLSLVRAVFVEIAAVAALMAVPATFDPEDGLTAMDVFISVPWGLADTAFIAFLIYTAAKRDLAGMRNGPDVNWRELPLRLTGRLIVVVGIVGSMPGLLLEYIDSLRYAGASDMDTVIIEAGTELTILGSHMLLSWLLSGLFAAVFISWYKRLPSVKASAGGIKDIFS